jgi:hypothetical protein
MALQVYWANVIYGTAYTGYFYVIANSVQDAALTAAKYHDGNVGVQFANGGNTFIGNTTSGTSWTYVSGGQPIPVYIRDGSTTWLINVSTTSANTGTVATYNIAAANNILITN